MKKKVLIFICLILFLSFITDLKVVNAFTVGSYQYTVGRRRDNPFTHNGVTFFMNNYYIETGDGLNGEAYCLAPGLHGPNENGPQKYKVREVVDVTKDDYFAALAYAYSRILKDKPSWINDENSYATPLIIGFRILSSAFPSQYVRSSVNGVDTNLYNGAHYNWDLHSMLSNFASPGEQLYSDLEYMLDVVANAIVLSSNYNMRYDFLVQNDMIWEPKWTFTELKEVVDESNPNIVNLDFIVEPEPNSSFPTTTNADQFTVECEYGYTCQLQATPENVGSSYPRVHMQVRVDKTNGDEVQAQKNRAKYGMKVTTKFVDKRFTKGRFVILEPEKTAIFQTLIVFQHGNLPGELTIPFDVEGCICEVDSFGNYTGNYVYKNTDGTEEKFPITDEAKKEQYKCTEECEKKPSCEIKDDKYYDKDGNEITQEQYNKDCKHSCQTPSESGDGNYYCKESYEGEGDGEVCSEEDYNIECLCPSLDPNSEEYKSQCTTCDSVVTLPSTCNDFDVESEETGVISDIVEDNASTCGVPNQVKKCVLGKYDATGESFESTIDLNGNPYCKVWCKENYEFQVPTARYSQSGGYFTISAKISGKRDCYISGADNTQGPIDRDKYIKDIRKAEKAIVEAWNNYSYWNGAVSAPLTGYEKKEVPLDPPDCNAVTGICTYTEWVDDPEKPIFEWEYPSLEYDETTGSMSSGTSSGRIVGYEEKNSAPSKRDAALQAVEAANKAIDGIVNLYNQCTGGWQNGMDYDPEIEFWYNEDYMSIMEGKLTEKSRQDTPQSEDICTGDINDEYICQSNPSPTYMDENYIQCNAGGCTTKAFNVSQAKWVSRSKSSKSTYEPDYQFSTYTQYGNVKLKANGNDVLWTRLPDASLPVALKTGSGVFPFKLTYRNIGQSNSTRALGRLAGNTVSVLTAVADQGNRCYSNGSMDSSYVCHYLNDCDDCDFTCKGDDCSFTSQDTTEDNCNGQCTVDCKTCIFDGGSSTFKYRTVSVNNLFPNECGSGTSGSCRDAGYNWTTSKADVTRAEIADAGESIYETPEYSYTLNPSQISAIKRYNREVGTYANTTMPNGDSAMKCEKLNIDGLTYDVRCRSTFLDTTGNEYFTLNNSLRNQEWTLWNDTEYCSGGSCFSRKDGIGPAWK